LEQLETELRKLHEFYKANEYVFGKVEECNKLWKQFLAIEQTTHDPERLKSANAKVSNTDNKLCGRLPQYDSTPFKLTFDLLLS